MKKKNLNQSRVVIKVGTRVLFSADGKPRMINFENLSSQIAQMMDLGKEVIVVTSGAVASGRFALKKRGLDSGHFSKRILAGLGARHLLNFWGDIFLKHGIDVAQLWLTYRNLFQDSERCSIQKSLEESLGLGIVPIVNENDVVSDTELRSMEKGGSDNDWLASMIALLTLPQDVFFVTEIGGVFQSNPIENPKSLMYREIDFKNVPQHLFEKGVGNMGTGGMRSKIASALRCHKRGMRVVICGIEDTNLIDCFSKGTKGTLIGTRNILAS